VDSEERGWDWYWVCVAAWAAMMGAWMAAADVLAQPQFALRSGALLVGAFPFAYYLRYSQVRRSHVNLIVLLAAVILGAIELGRGWHPMVWASLESLGAAYRALIAAFLWVTVMRAFALRTLSDMLETVVPVWSILLLVLVCQPNVVAVVGTSVALMGSVAVMAAAHEASWAAPPKQVRTVVGHGAPRVRTANSWPTVYVFALLAALAASQGLRSLDITSVVGRELQIRMARVLARYMLRYREDFVSGESRLYMGGPAPTSNRPAFEVEAAQGANWRLSVYTLYDGWSWSSDFRSTHRGKQLSEGTWEMAVPRGAGKSPRGDRLSVTVRARVPMAGTVPAIFWPQWVTNRSLERANHVKVDNLGALWFSRYVRPGDTYRVVALRADSGGEPDYLGKEMLEACLRLPEDLPSRVRDLARRITEGKPSLSSKLAAVGNYLALNYDYDEFPDYAPRGRDAVDFFLFDSKRGYCVHFAAAFVVMCRAAGVPARLVTGFLEGDLDESGRIYVVRAKDAHAWAEIFAPKIGWTEFDATPPRPLTAAQAAAQTWDNITDGIGKALSVAWQWMGRHVTQTAAVLAALVLLVGVHRWRQWRGMLRVRLPGAGPRKQVQAAYGQMLRWMTDLGQPPPLPATPLEVAGGLGGEWGRERESALSLAWLYTRSIYALGGCRREEAEQAVEAAESVRQRWLELRRRRRRGYSRRRG